jgi:hypothetical protein
MKKKMSHFKKDAMIVLFIAAAILLVPLILSYFMPYIAKFFGRQ